VTYRKKVQQQLNVQRKINESASRDFSAELLQNTTPGLPKRICGFNGPGAIRNPAVRPQGVTVYPQKLDLEILELQEFLPGSQNRKEWLRGLDSNQDNQLQRLACYQLHYPGVAQKL
jgi:hypothetical protein